MDTELEQKVDLDSGIPTQRVGWQVGPGHGLTDTRSCGADGTKLFHWGSLLQTKRGPNGRVSRLRWLGGKGVLFCCCHYWHPFMAP